MTDTEVMKTNDNRSVNSYTKTLHKSDWRTVKLNKTMIIMRWYSRNCQKTYHYNDKLYNKLSFNKHSLYQALCPVPFLHLYWPSCYFMVTLLTGLLKFCKIATSFFKAASCLVGKRNLSMTLIATCREDLRWTPVKKWRNETNIFFFTEEIIIEIDHVL